MTHTPRPGSIGERSIKYLGEHGRQTMRDLADGIDAELGSMSASLNLCLQHGLLVREEADGKIFIGVPKPPAVVASIMRPNGVEVGNRKAEPRDGVAVAEEAESAEAIVVSNGHYQNGVREESFVVDDKRTVTVRRPDESAADSSTETPTSIIEELAPSRPMRVDAPAPRHFAVGIFTDGRFVIEVGDRGETLTRDETETLWKFVHGIERPFDEQA